MEHYNIATLVSSYRRIQSTTWPLQLSSQALLHIVRWQTPFLTFSTWVLLVAISLTATRKQILVWCTACILSTAVIGGLIRLSQIKTTDHINKRRKSNNTELLDTGYSRYSPYDAKQVPLSDDDKKQTLMESRRLFLDAQDLFMWVNMAADDMYCLFIWHNVYLSSLFYGISLLATLAFFLLPSQWCGAVFVSSIFGINKGFYLCLFSVYCNAYQFVNKRKALGDSVHDEHTPVDSDVECNSDTESMHNEPKEDETERTNIDEKGDEKKKKKEPLSCILCSTVFTSVLRRRRYCRYCGNQFCPKCCFKKIPRSIFGATSPAAQSAKELVCNQCYYFLTGEQVTTSK